jgi:predicted HTH transcriptional regulator
MILKESETVELKHQVIDDIKFSVIAFANSGGGTVYIGVADSGEVFGLTDAQGDLLSVNNSLRDSVKPDITLFAHSRVETVDGKASSLSMCKEAPTDHITSRAREYARKVCTFGTARLPFRRPIPLYAR